MTGYVGIGGPHPCLSPECVKLIASLATEIDAWKMIHFLLGNPIFSSAMLVSGYTVYISGQIIIFHQPRFP